MERLQSKEMIIVCMNTQGVENLSVEMPCLCDIMLHGLQSVSRCIQTEKNLELDVEHSVPSAHYRSVFDILVV